MGVDSLKTNYEFQGVIMITLSLLCGLWGRYVIRQGDSRRSERACWIVVGIKTTALLPFLFFQLWVSFGFTTFMIAVWVYRCLKFRKLVEAGGTLGETLIAREEVI